MPDLPIDELVGPNFYGGNINSMSWCAGSYGAPPAGYDAISAGTNIVANKAYFVPFTLNEEVTVYAMGWINGTQVAGNIDVGIYYEDGVRLLSTGSTLQAGTTASQVVDVTDTVVKPGNYYLAMAGDTTTAQVVYRVSMGVLPQICLGVKHLTSAFPLPSTAAFVDAATNAWYPLVIAFLTPTY